MCSPSYFMNILAWCFIQLCDIRVTFLYSFFSFTKRIYWIIYYGISLTSRTSLMKDKYIRISHKIQYNTSNSNYVFCRNLLSPIFFFFENESKRCVTSVILLYTDVLVYFSLGTKFDTSYLFERWLQIISDVIVKGHVAKKILYNFQIII